MMACVPAVSCCHACVGGKWALSREGWACGAQVLTLELCSLGPMKCEATGSAPSRALGSVSQGQQLHLKQSVWQELGIWLQIVLVVGLGGRKKRQREIGDLLDLKCWVRPGMVERSRRSFSDQDMQM